MTDFTAYISLITHESSMSARTSSKGSQRTIQYECKVFRREGIRDAAGRDMREVPWNIEIHDSELVAHLIEADRCGSMSYHEAIDDEETPFEETFAGWVGVSRAVLEDLVRLHESGGLPRLTVGLRGPTYGWAPDGSQKVWDVASMKSVGVDEFVIMFPAAPEPAPDKVIEPEPIPPAPISHGDPSPAPVSLAGIYWLLGAILVAILLK